MRSRPAIRMMTLTPQKYHSAVRSRRGCARRQNRDRCSSTTSIMRDEVPRANRCLPPRPRGRPLSPLLVMHLNLQGFFLSPAGFYILARDEESSGEESLAIVLLCNPCTPSGFTSYTKAN